MGLARPQRHDPGPARVRAWAARFVAVYAILSGSACFDSTPPRRCFEPGDTVGWIIVTSKATGDTLTREPLEVTEPFCLE